MEHTTPASSSSSSVRPASVNNDRSQEPETAPTAFALTETIVPIINFGKLLGLSPRSPSSTVTTVSPVSKEHTMTRTWESLKNLRPYSTPTYSKHSTPEVKEILSISPDSSMPTLSPVTIDETAEQVQASFDDLHTPSRSNHLHSAAEDTTVTIETTVEPEIAPMPTYSNHLDSETEASTVNIETNLEPAIAPTPTYSNQTRSKIVDSTTTIETTPESTTAPRESTQAPADRPTTSSETWHYCKQCSQWHG